MNDIDQLLAGMRAAPLHDGLAAIDGAVMAGVARRREATEARRGLALAGAVAICGGTGATPVPGSSPVLGRIAALIAEGGIYDLNQHLSDVVLPLLRKWQVFERDDIGPVGQMYRDKITAFVTELHQRVDKLDRARARATRPSALSERRPA